MGNTASINLVFTSFVANGNSAPASGAPSGPFCTIESLTVTDNASGQVSTSGSGASTTIKVQQKNNGAIKIIFKISCKNDAATTYNPLGIVFVGTTDPDGNNNFPGHERIGHNDQTIEFTDHCVDKNSTSWK